jgi:N-carbamoyl-L-amino-acid hydrolase
MLCTAINDIGWKYAKTNGKATAARLVAWPNKPGILSDTAQFTGDVRHPELEAATQMRGEFLDAVKEASARSHCEMRIVDQWNWGADIFDQTMVSLVRDTARDLGIPTFDLPSQAGHDSYHIAKIAPTAMIFTPCRGGITHNHHELTTLEESVPGVTVLLHAVLARANRP